MDTNTPGNILWTCHICIIQPSDRKAEWQPLCQPWWETHSSASGHSGQSQLLQQWWGIVSVQLLHLHIQPSYKRSFFEQCAVRIKSFCNETNSLPTTCLQKTPTCAKKYTWKGNVTNPRSNFTVFQWTKPQSKRKHAPKTLYWFIIWAKLSNIVLNNKNTARTRRKGIKLTHQIRYSQQELGWFSSVTKPPW